MPALNYSFTVLWSDEDAGYIATSPEFPGLSAFAESAEEAVAQLRVAMAAAIETYEEEGWELPKPRRIGEYSGQFRLRLPKSLHEALATRAEAESVSLNTLAVTYLAQGLGQAGAQTKSSQYYQALLRSMDIVFGQIISAMVEYRQEASVTTEQPGFQDIMLSALYADNYYAKAGQRKTTESH